MKLAVTLTYQVYVRVVLLQKSSWSRMVMTEITEQSLNIGLVYFLTVVSGPFVLVVSIWD